MDEFVTRAGGYLDLVRGMPSRLTQGITNPLDQRLAEIQAYLHLALAMLVVLGVVYAVSRLYAWYATVRYHRTVSSSLEKLAKAAEVQAKLQKEQLEVERQRNIVFERLATAFEMQAGLKPMAARPEQPPKATA
jgi:hypothetical protein